MKPLLIDLDGTILDVSARHHAVYRELMSEWGYVPLPRGEYWERRREGNSTPALLDGSISEAERALFAGQWLERIESPESLRLDALFEGAVEALEQLVRDWDLILVTLRRERCNLLQQLDELRIAQLFRQVISCGDSVTQRKADLPGLERVREGGYVIGDTEADIEFASDTGRRLVCVANGTRNREYLSGHGARVIVGSIAEVPGALDLQATQAA
jgi:phosphoglycolate phosphatase-like HAD superfamily hydrolase